jgi:hypothetical protein
MSVTIEWDSLRRRERKREKKGGRDIQKILFFGSAIQVMLCLEYVAKALVSQRITS